MNAPDAERASGQTRVTAASSVRMDPFRVRRSRWQLESDQVLRTVVPKAASIKNQHQEKAYQYSTGAFTLSDR